MSPNFESFAFLKRTSFHHFARRVALGCAIGFAILLLIVRLFPVLGLDVSISRELQEGSPARYLPVMRFVSVFGTPWVAGASIVLVAFAFFLLSYRREAIFTLGVFVADGVNSALKYVVGRPRPTASLVEVFQRLNDPSFPSGHVVHYVVFFGFLYVVLIWINEVSGWRFFLFSSAALLLTASVSLSRVYLGVHWATDVLGGYMAGFGMLWIMLHLYFRVPATERARTQQIP